MNDFHLCQHCTQVVGRMGKKTPRNQLLYRPTGECRIRKDVFWIYSNRHNRSDSPVPTS